ncbi:SCO2400 family protein [Actinacidiphila acididurans]|uniref:Uncharacterized protein n=1 Tax=Actinacidiphila acididurans TaxID=2784346 RepID=A0ABS2U4V6_9ACTN|nr:hypothetical protein [Actinacidiphila acididurans]MBM9510662.1 hypothetical protein [Actinacidiphila acididurans]
MDYCYSCRRTLNGALVCPGCGAYAPDIAPPPYHQEDEPAGTAGWQNPAAPASGYEPGYRYDSAARAEHTRAATADLPRAGGHPDFASASGSASSQALALLSEIAPVDRADGAPAATALLPAAAAADPGAGLTAHEGPHAPDAEPVLGPAAIAPTLHRGRAARRRQMARWQKNRRRAGAAAAFALFGGGLTMAAMPHHAGKSGTTASAVTPVNLTSLPSDESTLTPQTPNGTPGATPSHAATTSQQHGHGAPTLPNAQPGHRTADNLATVPSASPSTAPDGSTGKQVTYDGSAATPSSSSSTPSGTTTAPPSSTGSNSGAGTTGSGSGSTGTTAGSGTDSGSGSTATGSGSGSGSSTSTPPASSTTTPPPSSTASTPPPQQLCLLVLCIG